MSPAALDLVQHSLGCLRRWNRGGHRSQYFAMSQVEQMCINALGRCGAAVAHGPADLVHGDPGVAGHAGKGVAQAMKGNRRQSAGRGESGESSGQRIGVPRFIPGI